jgi:membrane protein YqaA with SNARE-associated domain
VATLPIQARSTNSTAIQRGLLGLAVVVAIGVAVTVLLGDPARRQQIEAMVQTPVGLVGLFVFSALSSATLLLPVPGMALTVVAASVADPLLVGLLAGAGQAIGELTGYLAGSSGNALLGERLQNSWMARWMRRCGGPTVFVLALVPNPVFDVAGVLAGALKMPVLHYLAAAGAGKVIRNVAIAMAVAHGATLIAMAGLR